MGQAAAGDGLLADVGGREVDTGLRLVGQPGPRSALGLGDCAQASTMVKSENDHAS